MTSRPPVTFLLMPWGRVGSNLVNSIVQQAPGVVVHNEPLTGIDMKGRKAKAAKKTVVGWQNDWLKENVVDIVDGGPIFVNLAAVHILDPGSFARAVAPVSPAFVILDRLDVVATVVSAMRTEEWVREGAEKGEARAWAIPKGESVDFRPSIDPKAFERMVALIDKGRAIIDEVTQGYEATRYLYEDILVDMDGVMTDIFAKARIPYTPYEVRSAKFGSQSLANMIANPEEIAAIVRSKAIGTELILP